MYRCKIAVSPEIDKILIIIVNLSDILRQKIISMIDCRFLLIVNKSIRQILLIHNDYRDEFTIEIIVSN
jgi:hypothetical protein